MSPAADTELRVVVADDSFLLRAGVVRVLEATGFAVVGEASDGDELIDRALELRPDVVVTDIRMPPSETDEGLHAAARIRAQLPGTGVLVLSQYVNQAYVTRLMNDGAQGVGYLLKDRVLEPAGFSDAVREVARGGTVMDPEVVSQLLERRRPGSAIDALSEREREVLARMAEGQANRTIADGLAISEHTLARELTSIFDKLALPVDGEGHRRVLAVLAYLREEGR